MAKSSVVPWERAKSLGAPPPSDWIRKLMDQEEPDEVARQTAEADKWERISQKLRDNATDARRANDPARARELDAAAGPLQTGAKGGQYYVGPSGMKVYVKK